MKYEYTQELDDILLKYGRVDDIANEGFDLVREWEIGATIDTEESGFSRLAKLRKADGNFVAIFPWCVFFGNEEDMGHDEHVSTLFIVALSKLCAEVDKYITRIEKELCNEQE